MRRFFPFIKDEIARGSARALWQRELNHIIADIAYMEGLTQTHIRTYDGMIEKTVLIQEANEDKLAIEARIAELN